MGIYGALSTAVTGLQAQSFALENISGNIANSQTVGYKRIETSFIDMVPDGTPLKQNAGAVVADSRATNTVAGSVSTSDVPTNMAITGQGFFIVQQKTSEVDGKAVFAGGDLYTRRGDFDIDKEGYLVNGAGYYLEGLPIDQTTGNVSGTVPAAIKISNNLLPALATSQVDYQLNLPQVPQDASYSSTVPNSELLNKSDFLPTTITTPATATGTTTLTGTNAASTVMAPGDSLTVSINGTPTTFDFYDSGAGAYAGANQGIDVASGVDISTALAAIQTSLRANGGTGATSATVGLSGGKVAVTLGSNLTDSMTITDQTTGLGLASQAYDPTGPAPTGPVNTVTGAQNTNFLNESISGGAITLYASTGQPVNVQFRWAKTDSTTNGGTDTWNLYYMTNSTATGSTPQWVNVGTDYKFNSSGALSPAVTSTTINNLTVNGVSLGNIVLQHGTGGVTQFADANGSASVTTLTQDGYPAGKFTSVAVDDSGRVVASYSNGQQIRVAQVVLANFNAADSLKRLDGGAFEETSASGSPTFNTNPTIAGSSLEGSNTDISTEFSQLIVTQQAYAAGAKIVTSANDMLQQALNMIR